MLASVIGSLHSKTLYWRAGFLLKAFSFEKGCSNRPATQNCLIWICLEGLVSLLPFPLTRLPPFPLVKGAQVKEYVAVCWLWLFGRMIPCARLTGLEYPCPAMKTLISGRGRWLYGFSASASTSGGSQLHESAATCPWMGRGEQHSTALAASKCWCVEKCSLCCYLLLSRKGWIDAI